MHTELALGLRARIAVARAGLVGRGPDRELTRPPRRSNSMRRCGWRFRRCRWPSRANFGAVILARWARPG